MTDYQLTEFEKQVDVVVEALRTSNGKIVYHAFTMAPTENLADMRDMIEHILSERQVNE